MFQTKKFSNRADACRQMRKKAKEIYNFDLPENMDMSKTKISLNKRHVFFRANTGYDVWQTEIKGPGKQFLLCDISSGNVELINQKDFN